MRNFLKLALLLSATTIFASTSQTVDKIDKQATGIVDKTSNGIDKVYTDGTNAIGTVYTDVKSLAPKVESAIKSLAQGLKVGAESVWKILVKQQKVWSWCYLIGFVLAIGSWIHFYCRYSASSKRKTEDGWLQEDVIMTLLVFSISVALSFFSIQNLEPMMTGFVNPEFGAMRNIITIASQLK